MEEKIWKRLIVVILIGQLLILFFIYDMKKNYEKMGQDINNFNNSFRNEMTHSYANIVNNLEKEASLLEFADYEIGEVDTEALKIPISWKVIPKEVSANTYVYLDINGEKISMERKETSFEKTILFDAFEEINPKLIIDESGVQKTIIDDRLSYIDLEEEVFPHVYPDFMGSSQYNDEIYIREGNLHLDKIREESPIEFKKANFLIKVDEKTISEKDISDELWTTGYEVYEKVPLKKDETCKMYLVLEDNLGLEHHFVVDYFNGSNEKYFEHRDDRKIYSKDGKLLK